MIRFLIFILLAIFYISLVFVLDGLDAGVPITAIVFLLYGATCAHIGEKLKNRKNGVGKIYY